MWFIQPKRDYVAEMPWQHADEPALMAWQIRTRDYHILIANVIFFIMFFVALGGGYLLSHAGEDSLVESFMWGGGVFLFIILITMSMTHQTSIIVYRLTEQRIEVFSWKPQIDSVKPVLTWTAIVSGVGVLFLVFVNPAFLVAAIGPVGLGIAAALMGTSKSYRSLVRDDQRYEIDWPNAEEIAVWRQRRLIGLCFTWHNEDGSHYSVYDKVYCRKQDFETCLAFFRERLPHTPYRESKLVVHSHFATLPK